MALMNRGSETGDSVFVRLTSSPPKFSWHEPTPLPESPNLAGELEKHETSRLM